MWSTIRIYLLIIPVVFVIDFLWLGIVMSRFYKSELGVLARRAGDSLTPVWWAAFIVYLLIPLGIILFALPRVSPSGAFPSALFWGFLYGATLYGIYEMTNYAMVQGCIHVFFLLVPAFAGFLVAACCCKPCQCNHS